MNTKDTAVTGSECYLQVTEAKLLRNHLIRKFFNLKTMTSKISWLCFLLPRTGAGLYSFPQLHNADFQ